MTVHPQFADDLALYALSVLEGEERAGLEKHLEECGSCRHELERLRGDMALLALSTSGPTPPQRARERLLKAVKREKRAQAVTVQRTWRAFVPWVTAAACLLVAAWFWRQKVDIVQQLLHSQKESATQQTELEHAREVLATLTATDAMIVPITAPNAKPQPQGKAIYIRDRARLIFLASNLPLLPPEKAYELWLIPVEGAPIPAGVFKPDARGSALVIHPPLPTGVEAKAFAITVEPAAGSSTPTMPIVMLGGAS